MDQSVWSSGTLPWQEFETYCSNIIVTNYQT